MSKPKRGKQSAAPANRAPHSDSTAASTQPGEAVVTETPPAPSTANDTRVSAPQPESRIRLEAAALGTILFVLYAVGACRSIYVGDSGELVAASYLLGIPHPSGYPLYAMSGKLFQLLVPIGSIAFRMSLFSAVCAAAACALLYRLCRRMGFHPSAALFGALLLAFAPSYWGEANVQRVYALGAVFVVGAFSTANAWLESRRPRDLYLTFFLCGLGATNHTFMGFFAIAFGLFVLLVDARAILAPRHLATALAVTFFGLLPYAYLPIRSMANPPLDWGDPETFDRFLAAVLRKDFWVRKWIETPADLIEIAVDYVKSLGVELAWLGTAAAVFGAVRHWGRRSAVVLALLVMLANVGAMASHGSRSDIFIWHRYYIPTYAMAAWLAALGWNSLRSRLPAQAAWAVLLVPAFLFVSGWKEFDRSRYRLAESFSRRVLDSLPPGAHLIATDDNILFVLIYLHFVENLRPDIDLILQGVGDADLPPLRFNPATDPLFFTHHPNWNMPALAIVPRGIVFQAWAANEPPPKPIPVPPLLDGEDDPNVPRDYLTKNLVGHFHYMVGFTHERIDWVRARREFDKAAQISPENDVLFYNLGLIYTRNGLPEYARAMFEHSHRINPRHLASQSRPQSVDRINELDTEIRRIAALEQSLAGNPYLQQAKTPEERGARLADLLSARGETVAARGIQLRLEEQRAGIAPLGR